MWSDIRFGFRILRKSPFFTTVAVLVMALGIGANTAIFSIIDAVMFRALPVKDPGRLVVFGWRAQHRPDGTYAAFHDCQEESVAGSASGCSFPLSFVNAMSAHRASFSSIAAFAGPVKVKVVNKTLTITVNGEIVSGDFFSTLGVTTIIGRTLEPGDDNHSAYPVAVLSYAFWRSAFGGDHSILGHTILINNVPFAIVGIAQPSFTNLTPGKIQDLWLPIGVAPRLGLPFLKTTDTNAWYLVVLGRLKGQIPLRRAEAESRLVFHDLLSETLNFKTTDNPEMVLEPAQQGLTGLRNVYSLRLYVLMSAVALILIIACSNVAGLLVARGESRQKELTMRLALGARRSRIVRQLLVESLLLSCLGGMTALLVAFWGVHIITPMISAGSVSSFPFAVSLDWRVLLFAIAVSAISGILFGLAPSIHSVHRDSAFVLKSGVLNFSVGLGGSRPFRLGKSLVIAQVALSTVILAGSGLLVRTFENLQHVNPGFDPRNLLLFRITADNLIQEGEQPAITFNLLRERYAAIPTVDSATYADNSLLSGDLSSTTVQIGRGNNSQPVDILSVGPDFLQTLRIPLLAGRVLAPKDLVLSNGDRQAADDQASKGVAPGRNADEEKAATVPAPVLVNEKFVNEHFDGGNVIGQSILLNNNTGPARVVGVVGNTKYQNIRRAIHSTVYVPFSGRRAEFTLRLKGSPAALIPSVREATRQLDTTLSVDEFRTETEQIRQLNVQERMLALLSGLFSLLALILACIGLYGLMSYTITCKTREIGIRLAIGAQPNHILWQLLREGLELVLTGTSLGILVSLWASGYIRHLLYGVKTDDSSNFVMISVLLTAVALFACWIPARRAMRTDPVVSLRHE